MAEDGWYLEKERFGWGIIVVSIILWLHDLLGRQIGADGFLQGSGVRWDGDLEGGHYDGCHIAGLLHHGCRGQIGGLGWVDLDHRWWRRQIGGLRGVDTWPLVVEEADMRASVGWPSPLVVGEADRRAWEGWPSQLVVEEAGKLAAGSWQSEPLASRSQEADKLEVARSQEPHELSQVPGVDKPEPEWAGRRGCSVGHSCSQDDRGDHGVHDRTNVRHRRLPEPSCKQPG